jgi:hypothetical protein
LDDLNERLRRLEDQEQRFEDLARIAEEREERREEQFQDHEEEREKIFQDHEDRRDAEAAERRDEIYRELIARPPLEQPLPVPSPVTPDAPPPIGEHYDEGPVPDIHIVPEEDLSEGASISGSGGSIRTIPVVEHVPPVIPHLPQLQEILDAIRAQQAECADLKAQEAEEIRLLREEAALDRQRAKEECDARIADLEAELQRTREELERERALRAEEERARLEAESAAAAERHEAMMTQLGDITNLVHQQREECERKNELMESRWAEKENRRATKDEQIALLRATLERMELQMEAERAERQREREEAAQRPSKP